MDISFRKSTVVHMIRVYPEDAERWRQLINDQSDKSDGHPQQVDKIVKVGVRIYLNDKIRWSKILKRAAVEDKKAADVFKKMLDIADRSRFNLEGRKVADIFKYLLDMYEREEILYPYDG